MELELDDWKDYCENFHKFNKYSVDTHNKIIRFKPGIQRKIVKCLMQFSRPMTCDEIEHKTGMKHQTVSACITQLKANEILEVVGIGYTSSGCHAGLNALCTYKEAKDA
jgi:Fic family protein